MLFKIYFRSIKYNGRLGLHTTCRLPQVLIPNLVIYQGKWEQKKLAGVPTSATRPTTNPYGDSFEKKNKMMRYSIFGIRIPLKRSQKLIAISKIAIAESYHQGLTMSEKLG